MNPVGVAWKGGLKDVDEIISINDIPIDALGYLGVYGFLADTSILEYEFRVMPPESHQEDVVVTIE